MFAIQKIIKKKENVRNSFGLALGEEVPQRQKAAPAAAVARQPDDELDSAAAATAAELPTRCS